MNIISVYCLLGGCYIGLLFVMKYESLHVKNLSLCHMTRFRIAYEKANWLVVLGLTTP